jgi:hypothetical protein
VIYSTLIIVWQLYAEPYHVLTKVRYHIPLRPYYNPYRPWCCTVRGTGCSTNAAADQVPLRPDLVAEPLPRRRDLRGPPAPGDKPRGSFLCLAILRCLIGV